MARRRLTPLSDVPRAEHFPEGGGLEAKAFAPGFAPPIARVAAEAAGASAFSRLGASIVTTSSSESGTGWWVWPTNPVTPGVCRTAPHDSSVRSIRTRT